MRTRPIILVSAGLNLVFAVVLFRALWRNGEDDLLSYLLLPQTTEVTHSYKTNTVVRRLQFNWDEVESEDYATYIQNLRAVGCPEPTIRDIIVADVDQLYARKRAAMIVTPEHQWWLSEPDPATVEAAEQQQRELEAERRELLTRLLGPGWEPVADLEGRDLQLALTGPVLGDLAPAAKQAVMAILDRARQQEQEYWDQQGDKVDPRKLAEFHEQTRAALAKVLTPEQLEEYLLRYSQNAASLRQEVRGLNLTPEEFRTLFRLRDPLDQQIQLQFGGDDPESARQRQLLEKQRDTVLKEVLGPERAREFTLSRDPVYQQTKTAVEQLGAPERLLDPLYQISQLSAAERKRIEENTQLTAKQKTLALEHIKAGEQESLQTLLGEEAYARYQFFERYGVVPREPIKTDPSEGWLSQTQQRYGLGPGLPGAETISLGAKLLPPLPPGAAEPTADKPQPQAGEKSPPLVLRPEE